MTVGNGVEDLDAKIRELDKQLEAKRAARALRDAEREKREALQQKQNEAILEDLRERFEGEGEEGVHYAICDLTSLNGGFIVVKRGPAALVRAYKVKLRGDNTPSEADTHALVKANLLYPDVDELNRLTGELEFLAIKLANVICEMHAVGVELKGGKR